MEEETLPILDADSGVPPEYLADVAHAKRFLERWFADDLFRQKLGADGAAAFREYGLRGDPETVRELWDEEAARARPAGTLPPLTVRRHRGFCSEKLGHRERLRMQDCAPSEPTFRAWRERQICRTWGELGAPHAAAIVHAPWTVELSKGCSVGCPFCGVGAQGLKAVFAYTPENRRLWRGVLEAMRSVIGPAAKYGFCYWASEPLDNPDYEKFLEDYRDLLGVFPQTTTALSVKDAERTRRLIERTRQGGCFINRFSVLSLGQFDRIMREFTAEELLYVELVAQNKESLGRKSYCGRARNLPREEVQLAQLPKDDNHSGTSACVSGFLLNMVERSVQLLTPCNASERWPYGSWVYETAHFETASELEGIARDMIRRHMPVSIGRKDRPRFRPDLGISSLPTGFAAATSHLVLKFESEPFLTRLSELIATREMEAGQLAIALEEEQGIEPARTFHALNSLFKGGIFDEAPTGGR